MSQIVANPDKLEQLSGAFAGAETALQDMSSSLSRAVGRLAWEVRAQRDMDNRMQVAARHCRELGETITSMKRFLQNAANAYRQAERTCADMRLIDRAIDGRPAWLAGMTLVTAPAFGANLNWHRQVIAILNEDTFRNKYPIVGEHRIYTGIEQCKGFVKQYYRDVFGISRLPATKVVNKRHTHELNVTDSSPIKLIGQIDRSTLGKTVFTTENQNQSGDHMKSLFAQARRGDIIQSYNGQNGIVHSAIFMSYDPEAAVVTVYDANYGKPANVIREHTLTIQDYVGMVSAPNGGISIYAKK